MEQVASRSILALRLPDPRFSIDFANYALDSKSCATSKKYMQDLFPGQNKPLPPPKTYASRHGKVYANPQRELTGGLSPSPMALPILDNDWDAHTIECMVMLDEPPVSILDRASASSNSTTTSSAESYATSATSTSALSSAFYTTKATNGTPESTRSFLRLPLAIVNHVLSYVFAEERAVSITPYQSRIAPQQRRRRHGPSAVDIRSLLMHPVLMVCKQTRELGLEILYRDSLFLIELSEAGGINSWREKDNGKYWECWTNSAPPQIIRSTLARASNIRIQLPVPNAEATILRSATKRKKDAQEDSSVVINSLRTITDLITGPAKTQTPPTERSRSASPAGSTMLRRKLSFRSTRRRDSLDFVCRGDSPPLQPREPLSTLEVVLMKADAEIEVHSQMLDMVAVCSSIPVSGVLEYHVELDGVRRLWAKRHGVKWLGSEPDGQKLLRDLRALGRSAAKKQGGQTREQPTIRADVLQREKAQPVQLPASGRPGLDAHLQQRSVPKAKQSSNCVVARKIKDMENISRIKLLKGNKQPPTVEELQQIAADIRKGVY